MFVGEEVAAVNTIKDVYGNDTGIYENKIYLLVDEYAASLPDPHILTTPNNGAFTGLVKYINKQMQFDKSILDDIKLLNDLWNIYTELVYKYNQKPTIEEYALFTGIGRATIYDWLSGYTRSDDYNEELSSYRSDIIKKWQEECKLGRYKMAASGNVGGIFLCKAIDGLCETAPIQVEQPKRVLSLDQLPVLSETDGKKRHLGAKSLEMLNKAKQER